MGAQNQRAAPARWVSQPVTLQAHWALAIGQSPLIARRDCVGRVPWLNQPTNPLPALETRERIVPLGYALLVRQPI